MTIIDQLQLNKYIFGLTLSSLVQNLFEWNLCYFVNINCISAWYGICILYIYNEYTSLNLILILYIR